MKKMHYSVLLLSVILIFTTCGPTKEETAVNDFIASHLEQIKPLEKEMALAYWSAATTGKEEDFSAYGDLELQLRKIYSNPDEYSQLKDLKKSGEVNDPLLARQVDLLLNNYLENQVDPLLLKKIVNLSTKVEQTFSTYRGNIDGRKVTGNDIKRILKDETDTKTRKKAWLASKQVGNAVAADVIQLARLRNQAARKLGFENYHTMKLAVGEQDVKVVSQIFDELYGLTNEPFKKLKSELDKKLSSLYGVPVNDLMPWHYHDPFFQETPLIYDIDLDAYYQNANIRELAAEFYRGIHLPVESILEASDLYEREGKNPHAFCIDIDKEGDVRVLCNLKNNESWMETLLHELGHGVYDKYLDPEVPYLLRQPAHSFTTEAIAMFFGRLSRNPSWMKVMLNLTDEQKNEIQEVTEKYAQMKQLIFARWAMVMYNFEKSFYADPDQDLNELWWNLVEKYQFIKKPGKRNEPDWASKIHIVSYPAYYHNYLLGELLASQLSHHIAKNILKQDISTTSYITEPEVGRFLKKKVFEAGDVYPWNEMIKRATGEYLTPSYFVEQFVISS